ncbi:MAG: insulinase family protein [Bdellovibrionales bacterium]|nr:insulinase family protein [Bdellovibrionales bacterium]
MTFYQDTLQNGLTVIGERGATATCTALGFFVRTGARDETPEISGVSHFLEHMMFKGTPTRSALDLTYALGSIGAQSNAYTSEETTVYYTYVLPEYFEQAFDILSDMLRPSLDPQEFATEKNVILEEIALYEDRPVFKLYEAALQEYFTGHVAGSSVLGTTESVSGISVEQMRAYFDARYVPSNITLVVAGDFDWQRVVALANERCGGWENAPAERKTAPHTPLQREKDLFKKDLQMAHVCMMGPGPSATDELRYPAAVLACLLGDSTGSRIYWELVDKGLAEAATVDADDMDGVGFFYAYASCEPERLHEVEGVLRGILASPTQFTDDDLARAKTKIATRLVLGGESTPRRLMALGNEWMYRKRYQPVAEELKLIEAIRREDVMRLLEAFPFAPFTTVRMLPEAASS